MKDISGTITSGGNAQTLFNPESMIYKGWWLRNNSTGSLWVSSVGTAAASQPSLEIKSGELYETPPNMTGLRDTLSIYGATTSQSFSARVW